MSKNKGILILSLFAVVFSAAYIIPANETSEDLKVAKVLSILGDEIKTPLPNTKSYEISAVKGEAIIKEGITTKPGLYAHHAIIWRKKILILQVMILRPDWNIPAAMDCLFCKGQPCMEL